MLLLFSPENIPAFDWISAVWDVYLQESWKCMVQWQLPLPSTVSKAFSEQIEEGSSSQKQTFFLHQEPQIAMCTSQD